MCIYPSDSWFCIFVHQVEGTNWTYIANVAVFNSYHFNQTTVISYNKGANWSPVIAPTVDRDMSPVECYYVRKWDILYS